MRILVHEFASGGGLAGRAVPRSLGREGAAMRAALVADLARSGHRIVTTADPRFPLEVSSRRVEVVTLAAASTHQFQRTFDTLAASADGVWLIAPETDRCLERLAARVEARGGSLLGPGAVSIRRASDKAGLSRLLGRNGVLYPKTRSIVFDRPSRAWNSRLSTIARTVGYPMVVKPARGAGCQGVWLVRDARELRGAVLAARRGAARGRLLLQQYVAGVAASVSLVGDGRGAVALAVNSQDMRRGRPFAYRGGTTPFDHPLAPQAAAVAVRACEVVSGLRGYIGVDLVLAGDEAVVIEINPRLTTAYLGVRRVVRENVAELALAACAGILPVPPAAWRTTRFSADGRTLS